MNDQGDLSDVDQYVKFRAFGPAIEWLHERTEHLDIFFFRESLSGVLFPMFCLLVEGECQILVL